MPRVTCRCGEKLRIPVESPDHLDCTRCGARIRLRRAKPRGDDFIGDGFIRFLCPCGRRLKVSAQERPKAGKCPDCGRVLPVPPSGSGISVPAPDRNEADVRTEELDDTDVAELEKWSARRLAASAQPGSNQARTAQPPPVGSDKHGVGLHSRDPQCISGKISKPDYEFAQGARNLSTSVLTIVASAECRSHDSSSAGLGACPRNTQIVVGRNG